MTGTPSPITHRRAQASLELLLVLAAVFAFSASLLSQERAIAQRARFAMLDAVQLTALERATSLAREAWSAGPGTRLGADISLPAEGTRLSYQETDGMLVMEFNALGREARHASSAPPLRLEGATLSRGRYYLEVENTGPLVVARWNRAA